MDFDIKKTEPVCPEEYAEIKAATKGCAVETHSDDEGRQWFSKDTHGAPAVEKRNVEPDLAKQAAKQRGIAFPEGAERRTVLVYGSDERVDRHGDIVLQNWDLKEYEANPVVQFSHDWVAPPIGVSLAEKVVTRKVDGKSMRALKQSLYFPDESVTEFGDSIYRLIEAGLLRTFSVGFYPGEVRRVTDDKERQRLGLPEHGFILDQNRLTELSATPIPANAGAEVIRSAAAAGDLKFGDIQAIREVYRQRFAKCEDERGFKATDDQLVDMWARMFPTIQLAPTKGLGDVFSLRDVSVKEVDRGDSVGSDGESVDDDAAAAHDALVKRIEALESEGAEMRDTITGLESQLDELSDEASSIPPAGSDEDKATGLSKALANALRPKA